MPSGKRSPQGKENVTSPRLATQAAELALELLNTASGVHKALLASVCRVGVHGDVANNNAVLDAINRFFLRGTYRRTGQELFATGDVHKAGGTVIGMDIAFHGWKSIRKGLNSKEDGCLKCHGTIFCCFGQYLNNYPCAEIVALGLPEPSLKGLISGRYPRRDIRD